MPSTFQKVITEAVSDLIENGFDSAERVEKWMREIRAAAIGSLVPESLLQASLQQTLRAAYERHVEGGEVFRVNPGVSRFTLANIKPKLRGELDRRILASANLIKLNRSAAIEKTLQRFSGWATSIPVGGSRDPGARREGKVSIRKALGQLPFEERRVLIDQGHKMVTSIDDIVATDGGAIAAVWRSRWRQPGYNYREDHKERDGLVYLIRGSWAHERGLVKPGPAGYTDKTDKPGEKVFCRCKFHYLYNLRDLPTDMLTRKGADELAAVRLKVASL